MFQLEILGRECAAPRETLGGAVSSLSGGHQLGIVPPLLWQLDMGWWWVSTPGCQRKEQTLQRCAGLGGWGADRLSRCGCSRPMLGKSCFLGASCATGGRGVSKEPVPTRLCLSASFTCSGSHWPCLVDSVTWVTA